LEHVESGSGKRTGSLEVGLERLTGRKPKFYEGDIVYGYLRPYLNKVWVAEFDGLCSVDQYVYQVVDGVDRKFIAWFMRSPAYLERAPITATPGQLPRIRTEEVAEVPVDLPPLEEQRRIAALLTEQMAVVERAQGAALTQLDAAAALASACLSLTFATEGVCQWQERRFGDVCQLLPSKSIATNGDAEVLAVTTACLTETGFDPSGVKPARMRSVDAAESVLRPGELLIARSNTADLVGRVARFEGEPAGIVASDLTIRLWPTAAIDGRFLAFYLSSLYLRGHWKTRAGGASDSMKKITRTQLADELVTVPELSEQRRIADALDWQMRGIRGLREKIEMQRTMIERLPAAILRRAFAGEI
jgi:type I restriction enzyme S subunit